MNIFLINGSPRKKYNTSKILDATAEGIDDILSQKNIDDVNIEIIDLYDLDYKGCKSCFHCKNIDGKYYGQCPIKDDLRELLPKLWDSDAIVMASPIYFGNVSGQMRSFLERLLFPKLVYGKESLISPKPTAFIYTMNVKKEISDKLYTNSVYGEIERFISNIFKKDPYSLKVYDTYQFKDYDLYENYIFDKLDKQKTMEEQFPKDLKDAYNLGQKIIKDIIK